MKTKEVKKLLRKYCEWWIHWTGLGYWNITVVYSPAAKKASSGGDLCGRIDVSWMYLIATITFYPKNMRALSEAHIEEIVVHELIHVLVNEMRAGGIEHEERVVTQLQKAFTWTKKSER